MTAHGYRVDPSELERHSSSLRTAGAELDGLASHVPDAPDAGELSVPLADLLARLVEATAELVTGLGAAGDEIAEASATYVDVDHANQSAFHTGLP
ncbi:hypothetical protein [Lentzea sp. NPDC003310]|uniref:WXG100 family type VII secretion target n=1 Tax=Lentzea sp. NPDC003310 TaxID=3154447 RepID=UPI0033B82946